MKTKKLLLFFITFILIACITICGCNSGDNSGNNDQQNTPPDYSDDEQQPTTPSYTDHTHQGNLVCSICGLDYFDEVVELIKKYGEYDQTNSMLTYYYKGKTTTSDDTFLSGVGYSPADDCIYILAYEVSSLYTYSTYISIPDSSKGTSMQEQKYIWIFNELDSGKLSMLGVLDANTYISYNTTLTPTSSTGFSSTSSQFLACSIASRLCHIGLQDAFGPLLELSDKNISPSNFGFVYFK